MSFDLAFGACAYSRYEFSDAWVHAEVSMLAFYFTTLVGNGKGAKKYYQTASLICLRHDMSYSSIYIRYLELFTAFSTRLMSSASLPLRPTVNDDFTVRLPPSVHAFDVPESTDSPDLSFLPFISSSSFPVPYLRYRWCDREELSRTGNNLTKSCRIVGKHVLQITASQHSPIPIRSRVTYQIVTLLISIVLYLDTP